MPANTPVSQGFAEPVLGSARAFRALLAALARPGTVQPIAPPRAGPDGLHPACWATVLTLCDLDTPVWLAPGLRTEAVETAMRFHAGCPLTAEPGAAAFAILDAEALAATIADLPAGDPAWPDRAATAIVQIERFENGPPAVILRGPGIETETPFAAQPAGAAFWHALAANNAKFPLGIDVILTARDAVAAIPRSSQVEVL